MHHVSLRPRIASAAHLYATLQLGYADGLRSLLRAFVLLAAFLVLAVTPTLHLWRVGVVGAGLTFAWLALLALDQIARHWFMDALTLQDVFADAHGQFGGNGDVDTFLARVSGEVPPGELAQIEQIERQRAEDRQTQAERRALDLTSAVPSTGADSLLRARSASESSH